MPKYEHCNQETLVTKRKRRKTSYDKVCNQKRDRLIELVINLFNSGYPQRRKSQEDCTRAQY
jgi:hypothetical protein